MTTKADVKKIETIKQMLQKQHEVLEGINNAWQDKLDNTEDESKQEEIQEDIDSLNEATSNLESAISELEGFKASE